MNSSLNLNWDVFVFDWDGTVMDTTDIITRGLIHTCEKMNIAVPTYELARSTIGLGRNDLMHIVAPDLPESRWMEYEMIYREFYVVREASAKLFDGIGRLFTVMHDAGLSLGIATGKSQRGMRRVLGNTGFDPLFDYVKTGFDAKPKPNPEMLFEISHESGVPLSRMVMIGDSKHDLMMASRAGCDAIGVLYGASTREELSRYPNKALVETVDELAKALGVESLYASNHRTGSNG